MGRAAVCRHKRPREEASHVADLIGAWAGVVLAMELGHFSGRTAIVKPRGGCGDPASVAFRRAFGD